MKIDDEHINKKSEFSSRKAQYSDIPSIMRIISEAQAAIKKLGIDQWQNGYPDEAVFISDIASEQCYIFENNGLPAGVMTLSFEPEECYDSITGKGWINTASGYAVIHRMAVSDQFRGGALAARMLSFAEELCKEKAVKSLRADTHRGNLPMRTFLTKNGFLYCGDVELTLEEGDPLRMGFEKPL